MWPASGKNKLSHVAICGGWRQPKHPEQPVQDRGTLPQLHSSTYHAGGAARGGHALVASHAHACGRSLDGDLHVSGSLQPVLGFQGWRSTVVNSDRCAVLDRKTCAGLGLLALLACGPFLAHTNCLSCPVERHNGGGRLHVWLGCCAPCSGRRSWLTKPDAASNLLASNLLACHL